MLQSQSTFMIWKLNESNKYLPPIIENSENNNVITLQEQHKASIAKENTCVNKTSRESQ